MRPTRGPALALPPFVAMPLLVIALAACSSSDQTKLPTFTGTSSSTSATSTGVGSTTTATGSGTTSEATASHPTVVTIRRLPLPASVPATTRPVTEAWYAYWDYIGTAISDPRAAGLVENVGSVATGAAAADAVAQITGLRSKNQHTVGETRIGVTKATLSAAAGSLCSIFDDLSYDVDAAGSPVQALIPRAFTFQAALKLDGPTWRVATITRVDSC
ncbi:MAG: hypothetical protein ABI243_02715 [Lapillicoccus sp.]